MTCATGYDAAYAIEYDAAEEGTVRVPWLVNPYQVLGVASRATPAEIKRAFRTRANQNCRQDRVMASLSYHILTTAVVGRYRKRGQEYEIIAKDNFVLASTGYTRALLRDSAHYEIILNQEDEHKRTVLYIAARCGFYDTTKALLEAGAPVNQRQNDGSTPLHGAAYYGQTFVIRLLLAHGANPAIKNAWGNLPVDEIPTAQIRKLFSDYESNIIGQLVMSLKSENLALNVRCIRYDGEVIGQEIVRNLKEVVSNKSHLDEIFCNWELCWHGTKFDRITSIFRHGLVPSGLNLPNGIRITPPQGHVQLGQCNFGISDWAAANFVSPSLNYASNGCYAEQIFSEHIQWSVVIKVFVHPSSYTAYKPILWLPQARIDGEPFNPEYRVPSRCDTDTIFSVRQFGDYFVGLITSVVFIKTSFLNRITWSHEITHDQLQKLFS